MRRVNVPTAAVVAAVAFIITQFIATPAQATPITWTVSAAFPDGGTAAGSFVYDADFNTYSSINITTTAGSVRPGATYVVDNNSANFPSSANFMMALTGLPATLGAPVLWMGYSAR